MYHFLKITYLPSYYLIYFFCPWKTPPPPPTKYEVPPPLPTEKQNWKNSKMSKRKNAKKLPSMPFFHS